MICSLNRCLRNLPLFSLLALCTLSQKALATNEGLICFDVIRSEIYTVLDDQEVMEKLGKRLLTSVHYTPSQMVIRAGACELTVGLEPRAAPRQVLMSGIPYTIPRDIAVSIEEEEGCDGDQRQQGIMYKQAAWNKIIRKTLAIIPASKPWGRVFEIEYRKGGTFALRGEKNREQTISLIELGRL